MTSLVVPGLDTLRQWLDDLGTVSYTHLDVYKRQVQATFAGDLLGAGL